LNFTRNYYKICAQGHAQMVVRKEEEEEEEEEE
jgi:hypothetical protein